MSVARLDLNLCIGCRNCVNLCPMDVFYFDETANKSVMAYPENCQSCAQCYLHCMGGSLTMSTLQAGYAPGARALRTFSSETAAYAPATTSSWGGGSAAADSASATADASAASASGAADGKKSS
ncbi:MAG: ferredoxin family protein [Coriobacteriales bacterium]|jgi:NAD-dependent dihydropyrimidine dehydrogenase PreA subunit